MLENDEWFAIVDRLVRLSRSGDISWKAYASPDEKTKFFTITGKTLFRLYSVDDDGRYPYALEIWRGSKEDDGDYDVFDSYVTNAANYGVVAASAMSASINARNEIEGTVAPTPDANIETLFRLAVRSSTGARDEAKSILAELDNLGQRHRD